MSDYKTCNKCKQSKLLDEFYTKHGKPNGECKVCFNAFRSTDEYKARVRQRENDKHRKDPRRQMRDQAKIRSQRRGIPFSLEVDDLVIPDKCPVLGIQLRVSERVHDDSSPSLDRIDPSKGYVKGNVAVISYRANTIKNNSTTDELRKIIRYMNRHSKGN
jgi:hypothetical protein